MTTTAHCLRSLFLAAALCLPAAHPAAAADTAPAVGIGADGTLSIPAFELPMSSYMSAEMRAALQTIMRNPYVMPPRFDAPLEQWRTYWKAYDEQMILPVIERQRRRYAVAVETASIGGVPVQIVTPKQGIDARNRHRVLINLHGGGFFAGAGAGGLVESVIPAALGAIKVISVDYRQAPQHTHPAASEDVAAVYKALLRDYPAPNIGIYGCSAGGRLTAMTVAWLQKEHLPRPGAIGIFCSSAASRRGDSDYLGPILSYAQRPPVSNLDDKPLPMTGYFKGADRNDPLVAPVNSAAVLAAFPPTLLVTGTRAQELSAAAYTHTQLLKAGVDAQLYVAEGGWHGFFVDPDIPEARDANAYIWKWFDARLGTVRGAAAPAVAAH